MGKLYRIIQLILCVGLLWGGMAPAGELRQSIDDVTATAAIMKAMRENDENTTIDVGGKTYKSLAGSLKEVSDHVIEKKAAADAIVIQAQTDTADALHTLRAFTPRGAWSTGTAYIAKDLYTDAGVTYLVLGAHTSTTVADDLAAGHVAVYQGDERLVPEVASIIKGNRYVSNSAAITDHSASSGTHYDAGNLRKICDQVGVSGGIVIPGGVYDLNGGTVETPVGVGVTVRPGALIKNGTLNIRGPLSVMLTHWVDPTLTLSIGVGCSDNIFPEWFGTTMNTASFEIQRAIDVARTGSGVVQGQYDHTYFLDQRVTIPGSIVLDFTGAKVARHADYTTDEPAIYGSLTETDKVCFLGGHYEEILGVRAEPYIRLLGGMVKIIGCEFSNAFMPYEIRGTQSFEMYGSRIHDCTHAFDVNNSISTNVHHNEIKNISSSGCAMNASSVGLTRMMRFCDNILDNIGNTAVFMRAFTDCHVQEMMANNNEFTNIGKAVVKFSVPLGHSNALIENCEANNNIIRGFGMQVGSAALATFRDTVDTTVIIESVSFVGNIIDGRDADGNMSDFSGATAIRSSYCNNLIINGNNIHHISDRGILASFSSGSIEGNSLNYTCQKFNDKGIMLYGCRDLTVSNTVRNTGNGGHGLHLEMTRDCDISGVYSDNEGYGIVEATNGGTDERSAYNRFSFTAKRNTLGPILYETFSYSVENGCVDDSGSRTHGDIARRDALGFGNYTNIGYTFFNTDTSKLNIWFGSLGWITADGGGA